MLLVRSFLVATLAMVFATNCGPSTQTRLIVAVDKDVDATLPEYLSLTVLRDGIPSVADLRVPDKGSLQKLSNAIATVQITLDGDIDAPRDFLITALSAGAVIARGELLGVTTNEPGPLYLQLTLSAVAAKPSVPSAVDAGTNSLLDASQPMANQDTGPITTDAAVMKLDAITSVADAAPPAPLNLITNGGFETGLNRWKTVNGNTAAVPAGPSSAFALRSDAAGAWCQQDATGFVPGRKYVVKATGKGDIVGCTVGVVMGNDVDGEVQRTTVNPFGTAWKTEAKDFVVPTAAAWMFVFIHNNGSPTCWTDDVSILLSDN